MNRNTDAILPMRCNVLGIGAWGPGFSHWHELRTHLAQEKERPEQAASEIKNASPKPEIIPTNERRRAPLPVKMAVEVSSQALNMSGLDATNVACVFGSGLGDTEITDYMCRAVNVAAPQLSPTKFHNSVHNAAAGYWTISTHCMKSANSIAAYHDTAGLCLLEGMSLCLTDGAPVLITIFDSAAHRAYQEIFDCNDNFAAAILIAPESLISNKAPLATLSMHTSGASHAPPKLINRVLNKLYETNPAAKILLLLEQLANLESNKLTTTDTFVLQISASSNLACTLSMDNHHGASHAKKN